MTARSAGVGATGSRPTATRRRAPQPVVAKRPLRMPEVILGVLLVAGCALGAVLWQRQASTRESFVVAAGPIERGRTLQGADLTVIELGGDTQVFVPAAAAQSLVGLTATADIPAGTPLVAALVAAAPALGADEALTSVALHAGDMPTDLAANDTVRIVVTTNAGAGGVSSTVLLDPIAVVWSVVDARDGVSTVVTLRGSLELSTDIAAAASVRLARVEG
ncbi:MAG TPA: SAF domain-containing protein [Ilumatobacteraceae bacterium]|nr:SAF domain-containing protein [Ilumatobacteraceae bacterium]